MIRGKGHRTTRQAEHLDRGTGAIDESGGASNVDVRGPELENRPGIDHRRHALGDVEAGPVWERLTGERGADEIGLVLVVADDADDLGGAADCRQGVVDFDERKRHTAVAECQRGGRVGRRCGPTEGDRVDADRRDRGIFRDASSLDEHPDGEVRDIDSRDGRAPAGHARGTARGGFVDEDRVGRGGRIEPEIEDAAGLAVAVAVERRAGGVHERVHRDARRLEAELQLIGAIRATAIARVGSLGIEGVVAGARHREKICAGGEVKPDE